MSKKIIIAIIIAIVVIGGIVLLVNNDSQSAPASETVRNATTNTGPTPVTQEPVTSGPQPVAPDAPTSTQAQASASVKTFSMADIASHSDATSCYTAIRGDVYDLTTWIKEHPGGSRSILKICGKDGTTAFVGEHGGRSPQEQMLADFKIGVLK